MHFSLFLLQLLQDLLDYHHPDNFLVHETQKKLDDRKDIDDCKAMDSIYADQSNDLLSVQDNSSASGCALPLLSNNKISDVIDDDCTGCRKTYRDPTPQELVMFLHAWSYKASVICACLLVFLPAYLYVDLFLLVYVPAYLYVYLLIGICTC